MFYLGKLWPKIILGICLAAVLNLAVLVPISQAAYLVKDIKTEIATNLKNGFDTVWKAIQTAWHIVDAHWRAATAMVSLWNKHHKILGEILNYALQITLTLLLNMITNDIVNWIRYGTSPRFITEGPWAYLKKAANNALGYFISQYLGAGYLCEPFALDLKIVYSSPQIFEEQPESGCTLSDMGRNLKSFLGDFRNGGWKEWIHLVDNNEYDAFISADEQLKDLEKKVEENNKQDFELGKGFLSMKSCRWFDGAGHTVQDWKVMLGRGFPKMPKECQKDSSARKQGKVVGICRYECRTETPSSVISSMANKVINEPIDRLSRSIANLIGNNPYKAYIMAIANAIIWRAMHEVGGLLFGGNPENDNSSVNWRNDKSFNASTLDKISNVDMAECSRMKAEIFSSKETLKRLSTLKGTDLKMYQTRVRLNKKIENQIDNLYNSLIQETNDVSTTISNIKNGCLPPTNTSYKPLPPWTSDIPSWKTCLENKMKQVGSNQSLVQGIEGDISTATSNIQKFQSAEEKYESAYKKACSKNKLPTDSLCSPKCNSDPDAAEAFKKAVTAYQTALGSVNTVLNDLGEGSVSSFDEANTALSDATNKTASAANSQNSQQGNILDVDNPPAHPMSDGCWSGTLYGQLQGSDITGKEEELARIRDENNRIWQSCQKNASMD